MRNFNVHDSITIEIVWNSAIEPSNAAWNLINASSISLTPKKGIRFCKLFLNSVISQVQFLKVLLAPSKHSVLRGEEEVIQRSVKSAEIWLHVGDVGSVSTIFIRRPCAQHFRWNQSRASKTKEQMTKCLPQHKTLNLEESRKRSIS
jgi:hypothetical protein